MTGDHGTIEREYPYQPGWFTIIACGVFFAACAVVLCHAALTNQRGLSLLRIITLSPGGATVFLWILVACSAAFVLIGIALVWHRLTFKQRLVLTSRGVLMPAGRWSRGATFIAYGDIQGLETLQVSGQRFLYLHHAGGKHALAASMLPSNAVFDEICNLIAAKLPR